MTVKLIFAASLLVALVAASPVTNNDGRRHGLIDFTRKSHLPPRSFGANAKLFDKDFFDAESARVKSKYDRAAAHWQSNKAKGRLRARDSVFSSGSGPIPDVAKTKKARSKRATGTVGLTDYFSAGTDSMYFGNVEIVSLGLFFR